MPALTSNHPGALFPSESMEEDSQDIPATCLPHVAQWLQTASVLAHGWPGNDH